MYDYYYCYTHSSINSVWYFLSSREYLAHYYHNTAGSSFNNIKHKQCNGGFLPDILLLIQAAIVVWFDGIIIVYYHGVFNYALFCLLFLKKNLNASIPPN